MSVVLQITGRPPFFTFFKTNVYRGKSLLLGASSVRRRLSHQTTQLAALHIVGEYTQVISGIGLFLIFQKEIIKKLDKLRRRKEHS